MKRLVKNETEHACLDKVHEKKGDKIRLEYDF